MAQPAPLLRVMLQARHRFHALPVRPTLWYWVCVQLISLPRLCLNVFLSHSLLGSREGQLPRGFTAATLPGPPWGACSGACLVRLHNLSLLQQCLPCHPLHNRNRTNLLIFPCPARITGLAWKSPGESPWPVPLQEMPLPQRRRISPGLL